MSGGLAVKTKNVGVVRAGDRAQRSATTRPAFLLALVLTAWGAAGPLLQITQS
jgi:hypothetical protein